MSLRGQQKPSGINAEIKVRTLDNFLGVVRPKDFMNRLHTKDGDALFLIEALGGNHRPTSCTDAFKRKKAK